MKKLHLIGMLAILLWSSQAFGRPWVGFFPSGACDACHGFPPQRVNTAANAVPPEENYAGGGGAHVEHVNFIEAKVKAYDPTFDRANYSRSTRVLCGPCHGEEAPHHTSGLGIGAWPVTSLPYVRKHVDIGLRIASSWGSSPKYDERAIPTPSLPRPLTAGNDWVFADDSGSGVVMSVANSRCSSVDCHTDDPSAAPPYLAWYVTTEETDPSGSVIGVRGQDAPLRTRICFDCHDSTTTEIRVYDYGNQPSTNENLVYGKKGTIGLPVNFSYDPVRLNVAANYYGTESTYGRGGHGDPKLATLDINSDTGHTITSSSPIDCTACHDWQSNHFPVDSANMWRLRNLTVENSSHTSFGLCNECHVGANYPGAAGAYRHHPSFVTLPAPVGYDAVKREVDTATTWTNASGIYEQNAYAPTNTILFGPATNKNVDYFTDWYNRGVFWTPATSENHVQTYPRGVFLYENGTYNTGDSPKATLPLAEIVLGTDAGKILCVTCHNPHGTDLFVYDPTGASHFGRDLADHNMLRLQDTDNTLCNACH